MKYYTICYPDQTAQGHEFTHWETLSEQDILNQYWTHWFVGMIKNNQPEHLLTSEQCIQDWCRVHWAVQNHWREIKDNYE